MPELAPSEIRALARIIDELDYYEVVRVQRGASARELKVAYYATSRDFHPDANRHLPPDLHQAVGLIARRVSEAYSVLRDPRRRQAYDRRLREGAGTRMYLTEARAEVGRQVTEERRGRTPQGRQYFSLATADLQRGDLPGAARHLQTALTFEPDNTLFQEQLATVREKLR